MAEMDQDPSMWVVATVYVAVMTIAVIWMVCRIIRYRNYVRARRSAETLMAQEMSQGDFKEYLDGLRAERARSERSDSVAKTTLDP